MSTTDRPRPVAHPPLRPGERLDRATFHERYEAMPPSTRAELIGGVVHMPSPLSFDHGKEDILAGGWLLQYAGFTPGLEGAANASTLLDGEAETQPDSLLRILPYYGGQTWIEGKYLAGPPELVVEVARSSRRIVLGPKLKDYERTGVFEYLVIALDPNEIHWFVRRDRFVGLPPGPDGWYRSEVYPGLWLDPSAFFANDLPGVFGALDRGLATPEHAAFASRLDEERRKRST